MLKRQPQSSQLSNRRLEDRLKELRNLDQEIDNYKLVEEVVPAVPVIPTTAPRLKRLYSDRHRDDDSFIEELKSEADDRRIASRQVALYIAALEGSRK